MDDEEKTILTKTIATVTWLWIMEGLTNEEIIAKFAEKDIHVADGAVNEVRRDYVCDAS